MKKEFNQDQIFLKPILVNEPAMPPLDEFIESLKEIWKSKWLTNGGEYHKELEAQLADYLGVKYVSLFCNGTLALMTALKCLKIEGEVITTPYTFVATTNSLDWNGIKPVFVDVDPVYGNIDPEKIESAITSNTTAILPVHVYGNPSKIEKIHQIADAYGLKVIYDAAHAFGVKCEGESLLNFGDLSILSFHATKVFNTFEGGAIISHDENMKKQIDYLKNFGFSGETTVIAPGINCKMNEMQAAFGLLQLKYIKENIYKRKQIARIYDTGFQKIKGIRILKQNPDIDYNYSYYPIFLDEDEYGKSRDQLYEYLKVHNIHGRRYFYPLVTDFAMYKGLVSAKSSNLPNAHNIAQQIICLPIYPDLNIEIVNKIIQIIMEFQN